MALFRHKLEKLLQIFLKTFFLVFQEGTCKAQKTKKFLYFCRKSKKVFPTFQGDC